MAWLLRQATVRPSCLLSLDEAGGVKYIVLAFFNSLGPGVGPLFPQSSEVTSSKSRDVYKLPPPTAAGPSGDACRSRIPSPLQPETQGTPDDEVGMQTDPGLWGICYEARAWPPSLASLSTQPSEPEPSPSTLIYRNMQRWKRIRQR